MKNFSSADFCLVSASFVEQNLIEIGTWNEALHKLITTIYLNLSKFDSSQIQKLSTAADYTIEIFFSRIFDAWLSWKFNFLQ